MDNESGSFISNLPSTWQVEETSARPVEQLTHVREEIEAQLANPVGSLPLSDLCGTGTRVVIVSDDVPLSGTRVLLLRGVLAELERAGVAPERVTLLIAARASALTDEHAFTNNADAIAALMSISLGSGYGSRIRVVQHNPNDLRELDELGNFEGVPFTVNYRVAEADLLIALSVMKLTDDVFDTGNSGSASTITAGLMSAATMRELRTTRFLDDQAEPSQYTRPLFERVVREGARRAGLVFALDAIDDSNGCALAVRAGSPNAVNDALMSIEANLNEASISGEVFDVVLADSGTPLQPNLYDATRAAIHIGLARNPVLMRGGALILPSAGNGDDSVAGRAFYDALTTGATPDQVILQLQGRSLRKGEDRAYLLARVMQRHHVIAAGSHREHLARASHFLSSPNMRDASELAESFVDHRPRALIVRNASRSVPTASRPFWTSDDSLDELFDLSRFN